MRICIPLSSKTDGQGKWVAKVSYKSMLAFYAIGPTLDEALASTKDKADTHFPNLANSKGFQVELKRVYIAEIDINDAFVIDFLVRSSAECKIGTRIPPEILLPLQMTLCPVVDVYDEDPWLSDCRRMIAKEEACYLVNKNLVGPYSIAKLREDDNGELVWDLSSRKGELEHVIIRSIIT